MAFEFNPFTGSLDSVGLSQASADARYVLKVAGSFSGLTGAGFRDTSAAFDVTLGFTSSVVLDAARALTIDVGNVAHTIALGTTAGTITFPNAAAVTVAGLQIANVFTAAQTISVGTNSPTSVAAQSLINSTAATVGVQSASPFLLWTGNGWKTDATAGSQQVDFKAFLLPVQGAANPSATLQFQSSINGGAFANAFGISSTGVLTVGSSSADSGTTMSMTASTGTVTFGITGSVDLLLQSGLVLGLNKALRFGFIGVTDPILTASASALTLTQATFTAPGIIVTSGSALKLGNAATTGLTAGVEASLTNATIVIQDSTGQAYRIPCII